MTGKPSHTALPMEPGQSLAGYEIRRLIHRGMIADVYRAASAGLGADVALKVLRIFPESEEKAVELQHRFYHEFQAIAALQHPNIVRIYDFGQDAGRYYIAMEMVEGTTLRDILSERRGGLPHEQALSLFNQVADALAYAHSRDIIHQDIRPDNILMAGGVRPVVVDFGLMRVISDDQTTTAEYSPHAPFYMSPEQAAGGEVTARADIYSLGILLYEMITGDVPFKGGSAARILVQHLQQSPRPPGELVVGLDPRVEQAILRALAKDPAERFSSPRSMIETLEHPVNSGEFDTITLTRERATAFRQRVQDVQSQQAPQVVTPAPPAQAIDRTTALLLAIVVIVVLAGVIALLTQVLR